jgi:signal transduction histidine kinase
VVQQQFEESVRDRRRYELSCRLLRPDGEIRYVQSLAHPVLAECGELIEYVGTTIDVTERRLAEQFLEAQINERKRIESERELLLHRIVVAQEEERRRISWEVHDELGQQLTALLLKLSALKKACGAHPDLAEHVASAEAIARQLDSAVDVLVWSIRPIALDDHGLLAAASNFVTTWSRNAGIRAELHASGMNDVRLARETETVLYRILQEALNNVAKHSKAAHVDVILERRNRHTSLIIEDNGVGFDTAAMPDGDRHFGLVGMRERAALVHGRLLIESKPGHGTTVFARVPSST